MDRRVTSPIRGPLPPCKQALSFVVKKSKHPLFFGNIQDTGENLANQISFFYSIDIDELLVII